MSTGSLDLEALKELCEKATPGPWETREATTPGYMPHYGVGSPCFKFPDVVYAHSDWEGYGNGSRKADADFIAASRAAVPALIAEVERLRGALDEVLQVAQGYLGGYREGEALIQIQRIVAALDADHTDTKEQQA